MRYEIQAYSSGHWTFWVWEGITILRSYSTLSKYSVRRFLRIARKSNPELEIHTQMGITITVHRPKPERCSKCGRKQ